MYIQICWLLQQPTNLGLHCLQRQVISGFSRARVNNSTIAKGHKTLSLPSSASIIVEGPAVLEAGSGKGTCQYFFHFCNSICFFPHSHLFLSFLSSAGCSVTFLAFSWIWHKIAQMLCMLGKNFWNSADNILTLVMLNEDAMPTSNFQPIRWFDPDCWYNFTYLQANSADPDQLASSEANWSGSTLFAKAGYIQVQQD